jgi:hypothetical protein
MYVPSRIDHDKHWHIFDNKSPGCPYTVSAIHGTLKREQGFTTFQWANPVTAPRHPATRVVVEGRATKARKLEAWRQLRQQMQAAELIF